MRYEGCLHASEYLYLAWQAKLSLHCGMCPELEVVLYGVAGLDKNGYEREKCVEQFNKYKECKAEEVHNPR